MSDDFASTTETTGRVAVGGTATGEIETSNDFDWFAVALQAGKTCQIHMEGSATDGGTLENPTLFFHARGPRLAGLYRRP